VRALTIAIVIVGSSKSLFLILLYTSYSNIKFELLEPNHSYEDFFDDAHLKLLTYYIRSEPLPEPEIQAREIQCLSGIHIMSAVLKHPEGKLLLI
jgi:hypothetical protein